MWCRRSASAARARPMWSTRKAISLRIRTCGRSCAMSISPASPRFAPLYTSVAQSAVLLVIALACAGLAGLYLSRRMVGPIETLSTGAARIGRGELGHRLSIRTGDELEALGEQFNHMAGQLQESY